LPTGHQPPPFVIVCDVGHCFEVYANFRRDGKAFDQFPDRQSFRVYLEDLRNPDVREHLAAIWNDPLSLDPAKRTARVTRAVASRLAAVSKALEDEGHRADEVAMFIMRCLFTMFAEDVGLLPEKSFKEVLERCEQDPTTFRPDVGQLWQAMDEGGYAHAIRKKLPRFNGEFFKERTVLPLGREEIGELRQAASHTWRDVDPSIFGTLLEQALDPVERRRLGAHYTPRAYVERLVVETVIEPLRAEWENALSTAERQKFEGRERDAIATVAAFHANLCETRVSTIRAPRPRARKRMASSSGSTRRCSMSSIASPFARRSTARSPISRSILIDGSKVTMRKGRTKDDGASAKRRCRPSLTPRRWRRRK
jgi:hypothetical protein